MGTVTMPRSGTVERWGPALLLVGGGLLVGHAAMLGVEAFSHLTTPPDVFGPAGHLVALGGLLGLYPALDGRTPTTARAAGAVAVIALVSWGVMTVMRVLAVVGVVASAGDVLPRAFPVLLFGSTTLAYVLFGVATVRVEGGPRTLGLLVLAPAVLLVAVLVDSAVTGVTALDGFVVGLGLALSMLALGYTLRTHAPADRAAAAGDVTAG